MSDVHMRKVIRDAAKTALLNLPTTGANVFSGRVSALTLNEMPALLVFANGEDSVHDAYQGGPTASHALMLKIEGVARGNDELIDTLDQIALDVETALFADAPFNALLMVPPEPPSSVIEISDPQNGAGTRVGSVHMMFSATYRTRLGDPATKV